MLDELFYEVGLITLENEMLLESESIQDKMKEAEIKTTDTIIADNENKTVMELMLAGYSIYPAKKGPGSIIPGLKLMKSYYIYITKRSIHLKNEFENYKRQVDKNDVILPVPIDAYNHCIDATRYSIQSKNFMW